MKLNYRNYAAAAAAAARKQQLVVRRRSADSSHPLRIRLERVDCLRKALGSHINIRAHARHIALAAVCTTAAERGRDSSAATLPPLLSRQTTRPPDGRSTQQTGCTYSHAARDSGGPALKRIINA